MPSMDLSGEWSEGDPERFPDAERGARWQNRDEDASVAAVDGMYVTLASLVEEKRRLADDGMFREMLRVRCESDVYITQGCWELFVEPARALPVPVSERLYRQAIVPPPRLVPA
jgi:hypothetical protein